jgi:hypothetical protein
MVGSKHSSTANWIATLSNGETVVENTGKFRVIEGQRRPWVRLCSLVEENDLHLTSLRLNFKGKTVHMPKKFDKFNLEGKPPVFYSLNYAIEADNLTGDVDQTFWINLAAHYESFVVNHLTNLSTGDSHIVVTEPYEALAPTPRRNDGE